MCVLLCLGSVVFIPMFTFVRKINMLIVRHQFLCVCIFGMEWMTYRLFWTLFPHSLSPRQPVSLREGSLSALLMRGTSSMDREYFYFSSHAVLRILCWCSRINCFSVRSNCFLSFPDGDRTREQKNEWVKEYAWGEQKIGEKWGGVSSLFFALPPIFVPFG